MINILDIIIAGVVLFYLLKNAGGILKTVKNILVVILILVVFGVVTRLLLDTSFISGGARENLENAYFVKLSYNIIRFSYPAVSSNAPKVDSFIKDKIISMPSKEVVIPKLAIPENVKLPKVTLPDLDKELK